MEEWKEFKLSDLTIMKNGKKRPSCIGQYPVYGGNGIMDYADVFNAENTIVVGRVGAYCGNVYYCSKKCWVSDNAIAVFANDLVDVKYLFYLMSSLDLNHQHIGGAQPLMTQDIIGGFKVFIPSLNIQEKIASFLSSLDDKIELNRRINENLEQQAQALFKSWFVDFEPFKDGKFVDSELGKIPEGWCVVEASKFMKISKESINPFKNPNRCYVHYSIPAFDDTALPVLQYGSEIKSNKLNVSDGMTLVSKLNPRIKRVWFIDKACENSICSTEFIPYKSLNDCNYFLYCYLNSDIFYNTIMSFVNGATGSHQRFQPNETLKFLFAYNEGVIKKFNSLVKNILKYKYKLTIQNQTLSRLRDNLLPKLMSGEINI